MKFRSLTMVALAGLILSGCSDDNGNVFNPGGASTLPTLAAPQAVNDNYTARANAQITATAANGVLANDFVNAAALTPTGARATAHGNVTLNADGSFTYTPVTGFLGTDTFTYTLTNNGGTSTATVTLTLAGTAFFVNNQAAAGGDGSQAKPFQTLAAAATAATGVNGAQILVFQGDGLTTGLATPITLGLNQTLQGFSAAAQPVLTGPITFTQGNRLQDLRIVGTAGTAVNATGASNGTIQGVTIANCTGQACAMTNATGSFTVANCSAQNVGDHAFVARADNGSLTWSVANSTFSNITGIVAFTNVTSTAAQNLTVSGCNSTGGASRFVGVGGNTTGTNVGLTMTNNTVNGNGTAIRGLDCLIQGSSNFLGLISANNVTGCQGEGMQVAVSGTSFAKLRFTGNRTLVNLANRGLVVATVGVSTPSVGAIYTNNTSDSYVLIQNNLGVFQVEEFPQFNGGSSNSGTLSTAGTIQNVTAGSLGIP